MRSSPVSAYVTTLTMLGMVIVPAAITLHTVRVSAFGGSVPAGATPYGYTVSLLLFLVPLLVILGWFLPQEHLHISRRAFGVSLGLLFPLGAALDFFFARYFFLFPNASSTLGIKAPALGGGVPVEEYVFYLSGFALVLLLYIWLDEYWLAAYTVPVTAQERISFDRLLRFHPASLLLAVGLLAGVLIYHHVAAPGSFPGYPVVLILGALLPSSALLPAARPVINSRALSLTMFILLVTSLMWEVTLALPYGWWNFQAAAMLGVRVTAWSFLPIEEVFIWIAVSYSSVIVYEIVKRWKASGRGLGHALLGR